MKNIFYSIYKYRLLISSLLLSITLHGCNNTEVDIIVVKFNPSINITLDNNQFATDQSDKVVVAEIKRLNELLKQYPTVTVTPRIQAGGKLNSSLKNYYSVIIKKLSESIKNTLVNNLNQFSIIEESYIAPVGQDANANPLPQ